LHQKKFNTNQLARFVYCRTVCYIKYEVLLKDCWQCWGPHKGVLGSHMRLFQARLRITALNQRLFGTLSFTENH